MHEPEPVERTARDRIREERAKWREEERAKARARATSQPLKPNPGKIGRRRAKGKRPTR